jgi:hypothetical protein
MVFECVWSCAEEFRTIWYVCYHGKSSGCEKSILYCVLLASWHPLFGVVKLELLYLGQRLT